jgi:hypothetical protein
MLVFIDDSGDPGFKIEKGSSQFFVIALIIFDDELEAEKMAVAIKELKRKLHFSDSSEFKYYKSRPSVRLDFLSTIRQFHFRVRAITVNKDLIYSRELQNKKEAFYAYFIKSVIKCSNGTLVNAKIKIDGSGGREFRQQFQVYLRKELNSGDFKIMKNCKFVDSKSNVLIQAADMVAGAVRRKYEKEENEPLSLLGAHIDDIWDFQ